MTKYFITAIDKDGEEYHFFNESDLHWSDGLGNVSIEETVRVEVLKCVK